MSDDPRTAEQLRAEIGHPRKTGRGARQPGQQAGQQAGRQGFDHGFDEASHEDGIPRIPPGAQVPVTRRSAFSMWLAPVIRLAPAVKTAKRFTKAVKRYVPR